MRFLVCGWEGTTVSAHSQAPAVAGGAIEHTQVEFLGSILSGQRILGTWALKLPRTMCCCPKIHWVNSLCVGEGPGMSEPLATFWVAS